MCIDCFSTGSNLKLRDSALCQEISQTFLNVNVVFTVFISKKHDSEAKAWLLQNSLPSASPHGAAGSPRSPSLSGAWKLSMEIPN